MDFRDLPGYAIHDGWETLHGIGGNGPKLTEQDVWRAAEIHELASRGRQPVAATGSSITSLADVRAALTGPALPPSSAPMWPSGNLPPFTVSGIDPQALLRAPWPARFEMASTPSRARAFEILNSYTSATDEAEIAQALQDHSGNSDLVDYLARSQAARIASMTDAQVADELFAEVDASHVATNDPQGTGAPDLPPPNRTQFKAT